MLLTYLKKNKMTISIGNDHAGVEYKKQIIDYLKNKNLEIINHGTNTIESVDYPDFIHPVAQDIKKGKAAIGIIICGSGNGAAMTANKHKEIRAALCWDVELSKLSRLHNNANILSLPARFISINKTLQIIEAFLNTKFEGGRHLKRINKIPCQ